MCCLCPQPFQHTPVLPSSPLPTIITPHQQRHAKRSKDPQPPSLLPSPDPTGRCNAQDATLGGRGRTLREDLVNPVDEHHRGTSTRSFGLVGGAGKESGERARFRPDGLLLEDQDTGRSKPQVKWEFLSLLITSNDRAYSRSRGRPELGAFPRCQKTGEQHAGHGLVHNG